MVECEHCFFLTNDKDVFCEHCGRPLHMKKTNSRTLQSKMVKIKLKPTPVRDYKKLFQLTGGLVIALVIVCIIINNLRQGPPSSNQGATESSETENSSDQDTSNDSNIFIYRDAVEFNGHSYYLYDNKCKTWDEVLRFCANTGGYPAVINDEEENEFLFKYMIQEGRIATLIGYTDREIEGEWKWVNGDVFDYTDWGVNGENEKEPNSDTPDEDYAQLDINMKDGHWNDCAFGWDTTSFICEWDATK